LRTSLLARCHTSRAHSRFMDSGYRCQACGERDARLDAHHNTYERYGDKSILDLVVLCHRCHEVFHSTLRDAS
jgi:hypothetical protein